MLFLICLFLSIPSHFQLAVQIFPAFLQPGLSPQSFFLPKPGSHFFSINAHAISSGSKNYFSISPFPCIFYFFHALNKFSIHNQLTRSHSPIPLLTKIIFNPSYLCPLMGFHEKKIVST